MTATTSAPGTEPGPSATPEVERLAEALAALNRSTRRELRLPIGASSLAALVTITARGPIRLGDLAEHEGVTPATLSRIVAALVGDGYAVRTTDPADRRSSFLAATQAGHAVLQQIRRDRAAALDHRFRRLSPAEARTLAAALPMLEALAHD